MNSYRIVPYDYETEIAGDAFVGPKQMLVPDTRLQAIADAASQPTKWCYNVQHNEFDNRQVRWKGTCESYYYQKHDLGRSRDEITGGLCDVREVVIVPLDVLRGTDDEAM